MIVEYPDCFRDDLRLSWSDFERLRYFRSLLAECYRLLESFQEEPGLYSDRILRVEALAFAVWREIRRLESRMLIA